MISKVFAIYDSCASAFLPPFNLPRSEMAIRAFADCLNSKSHQFSEHPEDYTLFQVATFNDADGVFTNLEPVNINLGNGLSLKVHTNVVDINTAKEA